MVKIGPIAGSRESGMFKEFKTFIARGNVLDLAVAVIIGAAFGRMSGGYADLKKAGVPLLGYGEFATVTVNFLIVAFVIFMVVRAVNRMTEKQQVAEPAPSDPADITLLREILEELKRRP